MTKDQVSFIVDLFKAAEVPKIAVLSTTQRAYTGTGIKDKENEGKIIPNPIGYEGSYTIFNHDKEMYMMVRNNEEQDYAISSPHEISFGDYDDISCIVANGCNNDSVIDIINKAVENGFAIPQNEIDAVTKFIRTDVASRSKYPVAANQSEDYTVGLKPNIRDDEAYQNRGQSKRVDYQPEIKVLS